MTSPEVPALSPADKLGRRMFSESRARKAERSGRIRYDLFEIDDPRKGISVDVLDHCPDDRIAQIAEAAGRSRRASGFFGWAVVTVEVASASGRFVELSPQLDNPFHADIFLGIDVSEDYKDLVRQHAYDLALHAAYRCWRLASGTTAAS
jgi:hypothetical protein